MSGLKFTVLLLSAGSLLSACNATQIKANKAPTEPPAAEPEVRPMTAPAPSSLKQTLVSRLLAKANAALERGRLSLPAHDNAFDHFSAVLQLDADNLEAKQGLDGVLLAYCDLARESMKSDPGSARLMLRQAEELFPASPLLEELQKELRLLRQQQAEVRPVKLEPGETVELPLDLLKQRGPEIRNMLSAIAERVKQSGERVIIYARHDEEGRWIYQTMKSFSGDYRIRGDIKLHSKPQLILLEALTQ